MSGSRCSPRRTRARTPRRPGRSVDEHRDLGRRRTLGITRADLAGIVTLRALATGIAGALLGCVTGWLANLGTGFGTPVDFTVAVGVLATLVAGVAALPPALYAARLDPVTVMRTP